MKNNLRVQTKLSPCYRAVCFYLFLSVSGLRVTAGSGRPHHRVLLVPGSSAAGPGAEPAAGPGRLGVSAFPQGEPWSQAGPGGTGPTGPPAVTGPAAPAAAAAPSEGKVRGQRSEPADTP